MEDFVKCAVDDAHSALANFFGNAVMADDLTDQRLLLVSPMLMRAWRCVNELEGVSVPNVWRYKVQFESNLSLSGLVSPNPGHRFVTIDEIQIEPRFASWLSTREQVENDIDS